MEPAQLNRLLETIGGLEKRLGEIADNQITPRDWFASIALLAVDKTGSPVEVANRAIALADALVGALDTPRVSTPELRRPTEPVELAPAQCGKCGTPWIEGDKFCRVDGWVPEKKP